MALYRCDVVLPMFTGDPSDIIVNTYHFESTANLETFAVNTEVFLGGFYRDLYGPTGDRAAYIDWNNVRARCFDLADPTPRVPVESPPFFTGNPGTNATTIPTEVAVVLSFQSAGLPGEVYQRRYNRVFLGAVPSVWFSAASASKFPTIDTGRLNLMADSMKALQALTDGPETLWVQVSNATGSTRTLPVIGGWVDNSPDTQRRRSVDSTLRVTWVPD